MVSSVPDHDPVLAAAVATLNDLVAELVATVVRDPAVTEMTRNILARHSTALGYELHGSVTPVAEAE